MGIRNYFSHVNPRGEGPNYLVRKAGYRLPGYYEFSKSANNIESIAAIFPGGSPRDGFVQWMSSFPHKSHLMGLTSFSRDQTHVGVGVVNIKKPPYGTYFVFISAPPNLSTKPPRVKLKTANGRFLAKSR